MANANILSKGVNESGVAPGFVRRETKLPEGVRGRAPNLNTL